MDSVVLNYQKLAKAHENFTFLHFQDVSIYLMGKLVREQEQVFPEEPSLKFTDKRMRNLNRLDIADIHV